MKELIIKIIAWYNSHPGVKNLAESFLAFVGGSLMTYLISLASGEHFSWPVFLGVGSTAAVGWFTSHKRDLQIAILNLFGFSPITDKKESSQ